MYNLRNSIETKKITYLLPNLLELSLFVNLFLFANLKRNSRVNRWPRARRDRVPIFAEMVVDSKVVSCALSGMIYAD